MRGLISFISVNNDRVLWWSRLLLLLLNLIRTILLLTYGFLRILVRIVSILGFDFLYFMDWFPAKNVLNFQMFQERFVVWVLKSVLGINSKIKCFYYLLCRPCLEDGCWFFILFLLKSYIFSRLGECFWILKSFELARRLLDICRNKVFGHYGIFIGRAFLGFLLFGRHSNTNKKRLSYY